MSGDLEATGRAGDVARKAEQDTGRPALKAAMEADKSCTNVVRSRPGIFGDDSPNAQLPASTAASLSITEEKNEKCSCFSACKARFLSTSDFGQVGWYACRETRALVEEDEEAGEPSLMAFVGARDRRLTHSFRHH
ncbi:hypothetical protein AOLI_G00317660 [Acnodon oligacanthus]